ncbi:hypothetical protein BY996DRAFT_360814 [Phakopsora pachyrhizi]|nr:hypothetical protein BY996DRAFT_360814 [Phakopsora pachyrhizi]
MTRLLEFRAGRCERRGQTNIVDPLPAKGLLYVEQNNDDGDLHHLCYKDLESGAVIDDFILFAVLVPNSATARVYVLCFSSSNQKVLYWMQDLDPASDIVNVARLNQLINDDDQMPVEWSNNDNQPVQGTSTQPDSFEPTAAQRNALQSIIDRLGQQNSKRSSPDFTLSDILTVESLDTLLEGPDRVDVIQSLGSHLPPGMEANPEILRRIVRSPDFRAALSSLDDALLNSAGFEDEGMRMFFQHGLQLSEGWDSIEGYVEAVLRQSESDQKK